jgi:Spy/CpxP family protein refolding chaperone
MMKRAAAKPEPSKIKKVLAGIGVLVIVVAVGMGALAGYEAYSAPKVLAIDPAAEGSRPAKVLSREYQFLQENLDLSREQHQQITELLQQAATIGSEMADQEYGSGLDKIMTLRNARIQLDTQIEAILTEEQRERYRAHRNIQKEAVQKLLYQAMESQKN